MAVISPGWLIYSWRFADPVGGILGLRSQTDILEPINIFAEYEGTILRHIDAFRDVIQSLL